MSVQLVYPLAVIRQSDVYWITLDSWQNLVIPSPPSSIKYKSRCTVYKSIRDVSSVAQNAEGEQLIADMKKMLGVPVFAYNDIQGAQISEAGTDESGRYEYNGPYTRQCLKRENVL